MIRKALETDLENINKLGTQVIDNFVNTYNIGAYIHNNKYIILVSEKNQVLNGLLIVYHNIDCYELEIIVVDQNYRNQGIGTNLLKYFEDNYLVLGDEIFLEVASNNDIAYNLYTKIGFAVINIRKKYYGENDAYIMKKVMK